MSQSKSLSRSTEVNKHGSSIVWLRQLVSTLQMAPLKYKTYFGHKCVSSALGGDSPCRNRRDPAWPSERWAGWGAERSATALLAGSCVGRPSSGRATLRSQSGGRNPRRTTSQKSQWDEMANVMRNAALHFSRMDCWGLKSKHHQHSSQFIHKPLILFTWLICCSLVYLCFIFGLLTLSFPRHCYTILYVTMASDTFVTLKKYNLLSDLLSVWEDKRRLHLCVRSKLFCELLPWLVVFQQHLAQTWVGRVAAFGVITVCRQSMATVAFC